ncbi:methyl-CpG-binding domain-containing protein 2-like [Primulina huaijiensis]|uniref:methyl-CpG-binding domain-containing protein 2-like n=1 Tax=Primulina huaijiensis TaxID=1492673 RepID=UPI003CC6FEE6
METETEPRSLKLTIKLKRKNNIINSSASDDNLKNVDGELNASNCSIHPCQNGGDISPAKKENSGTVDKENPSSDSSHLQLVLYDPAVVAGEVDTVPDPIGCRPISFNRPHPFSNPTPRVLPSIGAFTVQCANCFKWRLIPTKEKYEEIREHIMEQPFICENAREWRPDISCDDPPDITQDGSRLWAIDKPSIAQPPPGWQRLLRIRGEGSTRFADVYYVAPSGKRLRSTVEIQRYLNEHPKCVEEGVRLSQFSFQIPKPLQENYVRKRPTRPAPPNGGGDPSMPGSLDPSEVKAIEWRKSDVGTELHVSGPRLSTPNFDAPGLNPEIQPSKKKRKLPSKRRGSGCLIVYNRNGINVDETHRPQSGCP